MDALWWAIPTVIAWFGLRYVNREAAQSLALLATAILWAATVALVITWS